MKRTFALLLSLSFLAVYAQAADRVIGTIYHTDIAAKIDGAYIPSYNINGSTGIVVEDLADYGFDVRWDAEARELHVVLNADAFSADYVHTSNTHRVGSVAGKVYATDIKTYLDGEEVPAYNIGGATVILMDELSRCGTVKWDATAREISFISVQPWSERLYDVDDDEDLSQPIDSFSLTACRNEEGSFETMGENLDYLDELWLSCDRQNGLIFRLSLYQRTDQQTVELSRLLHGMKMVDYEGITYAGNADKANLHMEVLVNGEPVFITMVRHMIGNGHSDFIFMLDSCHADVETFSVSCKP